MSNDHRKELCDRLVVATARLYRLVYLDLRNDRIDLRETEMGNQYKTLILLADKGPATISQIADIQGCTDSSLNKVLDRLEQKKMIEKARSLDDRRVVICELAPEGRKVVERIDQVVRERVLPATETWGLEQLEAFVESMESINPGLEIVETRPPAESEGWFIRKFH
ncbi:MAG: MarR family transcriptional regulator [candidate division Zixibacteria bacterium]|nr:MarR family transcriptional regulator [candidate division Zixibacteria bacterium]